MDQVKKISHQKFTALFKNNRLDYEKFKTIVTKKETTYISKISELKDKKKDMDVCQIR